MGILDDQSVANGWRFLNTQLQIMTSFRRHAPSIFDHEVVSRIIGDLAENPVEGS